MNPSDHRDDKPRAIGRCPVTGLSLFQDPDWINVDFGRDYRVTLRVVGDRILHSNPSGNATLADTQEALILTRNVAEKVFGPDTPYVQIEDWADLKGASLEARRYFIDEMKKRERMIGLIFYGTSSLFKMSIKLAKRLVIGPYNVHLVDDYSQALKTALELIAGQDLPVETPSAERPLSDLPSEREAAERCPVTGLSITTRPGWTDIDLGDGFSSTFSFVGDRILLSASRGWERAGDEAIKNHFMERYKVLHAMLEPKESFFELRDFSGFRGRTRKEARDQFVKCMRRDQERIIGFIGFKAPLAVKLAYAVGKRLHRPSFPVVLLPDYETAVKEAIGILKQKGFFEDRPYSAISEDDWALDLKGFSVRYELIGENILHGVAKGSLEERHIDPLFASMDRMVDIMGLEGRPFYLVVGTAGLQSIQREARRRYIEEIRRWHGKYGLHTYVFYGASPLVRAAANMARPFLPFKIKVARDLDKALQMITGEEAGETIRPSSLADESGPRLSPLQTQNYIDEFLEFIGRISWESDGLDERDLDFDASSHPFGTLFEAISLIKMDVDQLLKERTDALEALQEREEKYRNILESIEEGYYEVDLPGNFTFVNDSMYRILGYEKYELMGMNNRQYMDKTNAGKIFRTFNRVFETGEPDKGFGWELFRKDGSRVQVETSIALIRNEKGKPIGFRGLLRDVTERKRAEQEKKRLESQLQHAQRMEAIGTLAGGIAHNFNNLLMGIQGNASLVSLDLDPGHAHYDRLKTIERLVHSGSNLTKQLLGYAREGKYEIKPVDLGILVENTCDTFRLTRKDIRLHLDMAPDLYPIMADRGQIEQILMNLFVNAADAMPGGGDLYITTKNTTKADLKDKPYEPRRSYYAQIVVRDTGVGMDDETRQRIFEPFFTTKGLSKGTGLGLASVYGIVKSHGGFIDVDSRKNHGTSFEIYLPATAKVLQKPAEVPKEMVKGSGTILVVDDEDVVLDIAAQSLKKMGYDVLLAASGAQALEIYEQRKELVKLVVLDIVMPDMNGIHVYKKMKEINPDIKVLLSSGYSIQDHPAEISDGDPPAFIQKPFSLEELSYKVQTILGNDNP